MANTRKFRPSASFWEAGRIALDSLHKSKLRSFLTLLGIILATTTLIAVTALIHGMNLYIADKVSNMGADAVIGADIEKGLFANVDPNREVHHSRRARSASSWHDDSPGGIVS